MKPVFSLLPTFALLCSTMPAKADNFTEDFETRPNATHNWVVGPVTSGFAGWTFSSGAAEVSTGQSVSGDQSLKFTATAASASISQPCATAGGGYAFLTSQCASR